MVKMTYVLILIIGISNWSFSQSIVTGEVYDDQNQPLAFTNILLLNSKDSSLVKGGISDESGKFELSYIKNGRYLVAFSMIGYETSYQKIPEINNIGTYNIGRIQLFENANILETVEVVARRPLMEMKIDRLVLNVSNNITTVGGDALEVLKSAPGIEISEVSQLIKLNGQENTLILINNKVTLLTGDALISFLRSIDAQSIDKIEIFDVPPAYLDAEGGGAINIILNNKEEYGWNGAYTVFGSYGRRGSYGADVTLNYRRDRMNVYGGVNFKHIYNKRFYKISRSIDFDGENFETDASNEALRIRMLPSYKLGLDYKINQKTVIGVLGAGYVNKMKQAISNNSQYLIDEILDHRLENENSELFDVNHVMFNFNICHSFSEEEQLSFDIDYLHLGEMLNSDYYKSFYNINNTMFDYINTKLEGDLSFNSVASKVDYTKTFNDKIHFQVGAKAVQSQFHNLILVEDNKRNQWELNHQFSQDYEFVEKIGAAYSSLEMKLDQTTEMKIGLRYELTDYVLNTLETPSRLDLIYGNWFPSVHVAKVLNENSSLNLSYGRRISRPNFNELAPVISFIDNKTFFSGNPDLVPAYHNTISLAYRWKQFMLKYQYTYTENKILTYQPINEDSTNTQIYTTLNLGDSKAQNLTFTAPFYISAFWKVQNTLLFEYENINVENEVGQSNVISRLVRFQTTHQFRLPANMDIEIGGRIQNSSYYGLLLVQPKGYLNIGIQKRLNNKARLSFTVTDLFRTNIWRSKTDIPALGLKNTFSIDSDTRMFRLSYSADLGNSKVKKARRRTTSAESELKRIN